MENLQILAAAINNIWIIISFVLVVMMQPGFAFLEAGLIRSTNVINVLFKNAVDFCIGGIFFFLFGYSLMWNIDSEVGSLIGTLSIGWLNQPESLGGILPRVHFLFNLAFLGASTTICSGIVAGRIKIQAYFLLVIAISTVVYPVAGHWVWADNGWLLKNGYHDFAGSSVVHCLGGFAGLAGALVLGPRIAKVDKGELLNHENYDATEVANYRYTENRPHNLSLSTLGTFLLIIGWIGFNGGSTGDLVQISGENLEFDKTIGVILFNTTMACLGGGLFATITSAIFNHYNDKRYNRRYQHLQFDLEHTLNGLLGGLVAITAGCDIGMQSSTVIAIGGVAGISVVVVITTLNWRFSYLDDPVGAFAVHGVCGIWGALVVGLLNGGNLIIQLKGVLAICLWAFMTSLILFLVLKSFEQHRVKPNDELHGLDYTHHGKSGYHIRRESLFNPIRKIAIEKNDAIKEGLIKWRQTAVRLSATGRFLGYETQFIESLSTWRKVLEDKKGVDPRAILYFDQGFRLIKEGNEELFDDAYPLICKAFEIAFSTVNYPISGKIINSFFERTVGVDASYEEKFKALEKAIDEASRLQIQSSDLESTE